MKIYIYINVCICIAGIHVQVDPQYMIMKSLIYNALLKLRVAPCSFHHSVWIFKLTEFITRRPPGKFCHKILSPEFDLYPSICGMYLTKRYNLHIYMIFFFSNCCER